MFIYVSSCICRYIYTYVYPPKVLRVGISNVNLQETLSIVGDKCPQNGSKNDPMAPRTTLECPHEGPSMASNSLTAVERLWQEIRSQVQNLDLGSVTLSV